MPAKAVIDIDGSEAVSTVLLDLLNRFPGLAIGNKSVLFSTLSDAAGIGFFPTSGAALQSSKEDVTGHVKQVCQYPSETQRIRIKEFLDALGKWLERQPVEVNGTRHQLDAYPALSLGNRVIKSINRTSPAYLTSAFQDGVEDWSISCTLSYENEFDR